MKTFMKITGIALVLVMLCLSIVPFGARQMSGILGDADNDGKVTIIDATRIQRTLAGLYQDEDHMTETLGDVNQNGLDILDATRIQRYLAGFTSEYPIGQAADFEIEEPTEEPTIAPTELPTDEPTEPPTEAPTTKKDPYELPPVF